MLDILSKGRRYYFFDELVLRLHLIFSLVHGITSTGNVLQEHEPRARILKHLLEAEMPTFRKELSFQRSQSTIGLLQATVFVNDRKRFFSVNLTNLKKVFQMPIIKCFNIKNINN
jgi:hypothetical protein